MRFPEEFLNELKSRVRLSDVVGRKVQLKKRGKDYVGLSPFSNEKTPSFYVHDDRGFYKCFSSQKGGDAITFIMETERLSFAEAVEKLARDVGMELPKASPEAAQEYRRKATLGDWVERACAFYEQQLRSPAGAEARAYLEKRGFTEAAWTRHRMGFAPGGWRNLAELLVREGASVDELIEAGLLVRPDAEGGGKAREPYDRFRNRVIFPIADPAGRIIAFGARTLDPDGKPKYLNSSDSPLFHKGRTLYRYGPAREAMAEIKEGPLSRGLIVTEGYVDAISLAEAGIGTAVAPLGTALTEDQIEMLWRAGPEPILCFDGDAAGVRAAHKAVDRALPMIEPGRTLYFVTLPGGLDPDDVIRTRGPQAMRDMLLNARPLVDLLWSREVEAEPLDTPERRAGLEARLMAAAAAIQHPGVRKAYERELRDRLFQQFRPGRQGGQMGGQAFPAGLRMKGSPGATGRPGLRLLVRAIESPAIFELARQRLAEAEFADADIAAIRDAAFDVAKDAEKLDRSAVAAHLRIFGRKRSVELLEDLPPGEPLDLLTTEGRDWSVALDRFVITSRLVAESEAVRAEEGDDESERRRLWARHKAHVLERKMASRSSVDEAMSDPANEGADELRSMLGGLDGEFKRRYPEG
jgi:DNA primase